ncbi:MAG TPA: ATP-binding protein, partial [Methylomirabilota bacterium]|nr:ATP-binding protein [Methylomirabilota bacterium]
QSEIAPVEASLTGNGERWGRFYVSPVEEDDRETEAAIVYTIETTEVRDLEKQVAQVQKMDTVGQLAGGIAHDFNNVLSAIMMATDFLLQAHKPTDPSFGDIMQIKQNANRAASLVRHLLAFSRRQTLRPQVLDFGETLSDLTILLRRLLGEKVTLEMVHGRDLWPVKADVSQLEQVVVNLAVNARDAMPNGGKLVVRTANVTEAESRTLPYKPLPPADYVTVEVTDTGSGIPREIIDKIFEPFFTTKETGKGTGLGLSTVYGIVKQSGGYIWASSEPGRGSTFQIYLPETAERPSDRPRTSAGYAQPGALPGSGELILIAEDEEQVRKVAARALTEAGYRVLEAANGREALEQVARAREPVRLVLTDVVMPEMSGRELAERLALLLPGTPVLFTSGYTDGEIFRRGLLAPQADLLDKPFSPDAVVRAVRERLAPLKV